MKPRKKWEPDYRFGGNNAWHHKPAPLGTYSPYTGTKPKGKAKRRKK